MVYKVRDKIGGIRQSAEKAVPTRTHKRPRYPLKFALIRLKFALYGRFGWDVREDTLYLREVAWDERINCAFFARIRRTPADKASSNSAKVRTST